MRVLEKLLRVLSSNRIIFVTAASLSSKMLQLMFLILFRRVIEDTNALAFSDLRVQNVTLFYS